MSNEVKTKEFYINIGRGPARVFVENDFIGVANPDFKKDCTHVIEMSAYEKLKAQLERAEAVLQWFNKRYTGEEGIYAREYFKEKEQL